MKKRYRVFAVLLALMMLLSGCDLRAWEDRLIQPKDETQIGNYVSFSQMEYTRPNMSAYEKALKKACDLAASSDDADEIMDAVYAYLELYDDFCTNYFLADIHYCQDLTDEKWKEEYDFCEEETSAVEAGKDQLLYALADSSCREDLEAEKYFGDGFFDSYEGESIWDDTFTALMEQESQLQSQYYALSGEALDVEYYSDEYFNTCGRELAELYVQMVALRQQIAQYAGYDSYPAFAYDFYHGRDYTPAQAVAYMESIQQEMSELYCEVNNSSEVWYLASGSCSERKTFQYVKDLAQQMGGDVEKAFAMLDEYDLYDIKYDENKHNSSFEVFLVTYGEPFIFMNPQGAESDKLTFAHEFGHFCNDFVCGGSGASVDVAEIHSQAMEYLSLIYGEDTEELVPYKMANSLFVYVEQSAYSLFEHKVYDLKGDDLTVENVIALYDQIGSAFGFDSWGWDSRDFVCIPHLFIQPLYMISYVVSNDLALQIYQQELDESGAGLETYRKCLESQDTEMLAFAKAYGLKNPLSSSRVKSVAALLTKLLEDVI